MLLNTKNYHKMNIEYYKPKVLKQSKYNINIMQPTHVDADNKKNSNTNSHNKMCMKKEICNEWEALK